MKTNNKKGFTVVELVIVIAIIAVLAAVLIPTFASIIKKAEESAYQQERTNQQIQDLTEKIENNNYMTWEDFEEKLAVALASLGNNPTADEIKEAVLDAIGDKFNTTGLTEEQVRKIIDKALESQLTDAQVKAIVDAAIKNLSGNSLTEAQVKSIVQSAINALPSNVGITKEQMTKAIADAIKTVSTGLSEQDVADAIANALDNFKSELLTEEQVADLVQEILESLQPPHPAGIAIKQDDLETGPLYLDSGNYYLAEDITVNSFTNIIIIGTEENSDLDVTIDLAGHALKNILNGYDEHWEENGVNYTTTHEAYALYLRNSSLTFTDSVGGGTVSNDATEDFSHTYAILAVNSTLTIDGGVILGGLNPISIACFNCNLHIYVRSGQINGIIVADTIPFSGNSLYLHNVGTYKVTGAGMENGIPELETPVLTDSTLKVTSSGYKSTTNVDRYKEYTVSPKD